MNINFHAISELFRKTEKQGRDSLFEHEVYQLLVHAGSESPPLFQFIPTNNFSDKQSLASLPGEKAVIKIVSPFIQHKKDSGGVCIIDNKEEIIIQTVLQMTQEVPEKLTRMIEQTPGFAPEAYKDLSGKGLTAAISDDIQGVLLCQYLKPDYYGFGNELLISLRKTREFGMVISAGLGGTDTELFAERFKKGQAIAIASTHMTDGAAFLSLFKKTISYKKLAGLTRGQKRVVTDEKLLECFSSFIMMGNYFSPENSGSSFVIEELEVNPMTFTDREMVPIDGLCRFSRQERQPKPRTIDYIDCLLHPASIGIIGASAKEENIGRIILKNILANRFPRSKIQIVHPDAKLIEGIKTVPDIGSISKKLDLLILAVSALKIPEAVNHIIDNDIAESVILITGGLGEKKGNEQIRIDLREKIESARQSSSGPIFLGGNSLGILSHPGRYDTLFVPERKLPRQKGGHTRETALISQSGAYMITRMSNLPFFDPAYAISIGNQTDLTAGDVMTFMNRLDDISTIAVYMEGFINHDGLAFTKAVRSATASGKTVLFYKAGRTPEGKTASSSHTASLAGDYTVCESCVHQAGAIVAKTFTGFEGLLMLAHYLKDKKISGNRIAAICNAGYETVGIADNILGEDYRLKLAALHPDTIAAITASLKQGRLESLVDVHNPLDVTPMANEKVYEESIRAMLDDTNVDAVIAAIVPMTPVMETLPGDTSKNVFYSKKNIVNRISKIAAKHKKPLIMVIDSGPLYDPLATALQEKGLPVFRSADQAVWVLGKYIQGIRSRIPQT